MNSQQARALIAETFPQAFDKGRFRNFAINLLNDVDESKAQAWNTTYIKDAFKDHVSRFERLGTYTSPDKEKLDVLIVHLTTQSKLGRARTAIRNFVADHLKTRDNKDAALVAFVSPTEKQWRFSYVKMEYAAVEKEDGRVGVHTKLTPARRSSYLVGEAESCHTAQSRFLSLLQDTENHPTLAQIEDAFSVEAVTKEFFEQYKELFLDLKDELDDLAKKDKIIGAEFAAKKINTADFSKKLMGQIVFLYFLQKKGWLGLPKRGDWGDGPHNFLRQLFAGKFRRYANFFNDILQPLFYDTLATDRGHEAWCKTFNCRIPFLNGGLFEPLAGYDWQKTAIVIPNSLFSNTKTTSAGDTGTGILDVFDRYNFTVNEAEPLETEVAIDPEMLGKVFENLLEVKERKSKGSFYTPREIVHYMCQESIINYLDTALNDDKKIVPREDIETFIHSGDQASHYEAARVEGTSYQRKLPKTIETHARLLDDKLADIAVCDPAIGSGAFPVGMMQEIVRARSALTPYFNDVHDRTAYHFKRHAIQSCIYGVDIDPGAVEIAKLRLWLSLVVDEEDVQQIKPLPNLDYKIVVGNSLLGFPFKSPRVQRIETLKAAYFDEADHDKKERLKREIDAELTQAFASSKSSLGYAVSFDFETCFSEVFRATGGFDVIIANPPYVDSEVMVKEQPEIRKAIGARFSTTKGNWDLYIPFLELSLTKLSRRGTSCLITPNKWLAISYGQAYRDAAKNLIFGITDYSRFRAFENVGVFPVVQFASPISKPTVSITRFSDEHEPIFTTSLSRSSFAAMSTWGAVLSEHLPLISTLITNYSPLKRICALEEAFTVGEAYKLPAILKDNPQIVAAFKFVNTGTIEPFYSLWGHSQTTYLKKKYTCPIIEKSAFKTMFPRRYAQMSSAKIVISGIRHFEAILDLAGEVVAGKSTVVIRGIDGEDEWYCLLGILNSQLARFFLKECFGALAMDGGINFSPSNVGEIPIPKSFVSKELHRTAKSISSLREKTGPDANAADERRFTSLIDTLNEEVFRLYGLTDEEKALVQAAVK